MNAFGQKVLSAEEIAKRRDLALHLIEHPEDLPDAYRRGDLPDLLGMAVAFADDFLVKPHPIPDWLQSDPEMRHIIVDQMCREWIEDGNRIPTPYWPWVVVGYRELLATVRQAYHRKSAKGRARQRHGVHAVGRMMTLLIEGLDWPPPKAAEVIGKAVDIEPESALREYHRYHGEGK